MSASVTCDVCGREMNEHRGYYVVSIEGQRSFHSRYEFDLCPCCAKALREVLVKSHKEHK